MDEHTVQLIADSLKDIREDTRALRKESTEYRNIQQKRMEKMSTDLERLKINMDETLPLAKDYRKTKWMILGGAVGGGGLFSAVLTKFKDLI